MCRSSRAIHRTRAWKSRCNIRCEFPHGARVQHLGTVNGTLKVAGVESVEELRTVNGNIEVYEGGGSVHARTTNGNVHLELSHTLDAKGMIAETTNGSVLLAVPQRYAGESGSAFSERKFLLGAAVFAGSHVASSGDARKIRQGWSTDPA